MAVGLARGWQSAPPSNWAEIKVLAGRMEFVVSMLEMRGSSAFVPGVLSECCGAPIEKQCL